MELKAAPNTPTLTGTVSTEWEAPVVEPCRKSHLACDHTVPVLPTMYQAAMH